MYYIIAYTHMYVVVLLNFWTLDLTLLKRSLTFAWLPSEPSLAFAFAFALAYINISPMSFCLYWHCHHQHSSFRCRSLRCYAVTVTVTVTVAAINVSHASRPATCLPASRLHRAPCVRPMLNPIRSPWSCVPAQWWTFPPYTFDWTRTHAHTSSPAEFCNTRSRCLRPHAVRLAAHAPLSVHMPHSQRNWKGMPGLGYPETTSKLARRAKRGERGNEHMSRSGLWTVSMLEKFSP